MGSFGAGKELRPEKNRRGLGEPADPKCGGWPSPLCPFHSPTPPSSQAPGEPLFFSKGAAFSKPWVFPL